MRSCEGTGKTLEQAITNALLELKAAREDVDIKVLSEGGFLKKAKVVVTISEDALEKYEKKEAARKKLIEEEQPKVEPKKEEDFAADFMKKKIEKEEKAEVSKAEKEEKHLRVFADDEISDKKGVSEKEKKEPREVADRKLMDAEEFLHGVMDALGLSGTIEKTEDEKYVKYSVHGEGLNDLIGHHGECMNALSQFMRLVCKTENHKKILLDIEDYRAKREESLTALAKRVADKVAKSGRYYKFEPMDASERKVIHTALQNDDRVTTLSKGEEPRRYLIVFPKEYKE